MRRLTPLVLIVCLLAPSTFAQPLADRVPDDAIVYVGWKGSANLGPQYEGSHTKSVVEASEFPQLFNEFLPDLIRKVRTKDRDAADVMDMVVAVGGPLWRHPSALYFGGVDMTDPKRPQPRLALLCDAGDEAPQLVGRLNTAIQKAKGLPFPITAAAQGNLVVVSTFAFDAKPQTALAGRQEFTDALGNVQKDALFSGYVDGEAMLQFIDMLVNAGGKADAIKGWPKAREALGLAGLKRVVWSAGFDGADWATRAFIDAPAPRNGLLALLDNQPLPDDLLKVIPKDATLVAAGGFDLSRMLAEVRAAVKEVDPNAAQQLEKGISAGSLMLGANIERDLIDPMGPHWAAFASPSVGGSGVLGMTVVNRLDDAAKAERTLGLLEMLTNNMIVMQTRKQKDAPRFAFRQTKTDGMTLHFMPMPFFSPSWAVRGQHLYFGAFPQVVSAAAAQAAGAKDSILDNESFTKSRARLDGGKATAVQYLDLPVVGPESYGTVVAMTQMGLGFADLFGIPAPPMVLPPLHKLRPHFAPAIAVARADDRGFYYYKVTPFPGADYFGTQSQALMGQNALMVSVLLPSLNRARETANRVKCANNLREIGLAALLYTNENRGRQAATLGELLRTQDIKIDVFACPSSGNEVPAAVRAGDMDAKVAWVNEQSSYVWAGAGKDNNMRVDEVLAYERMHDHDGDGINILFGDGHVQFYLRDAAEQLLSAKNLAPEVPAPGTNP